MLGFLQSKPVLTLQLTDAESTPSAVETASPFAGSIEPREPVAYRTSPPRRAGVPRNSFLQVAPTQAEPVASRLEPLREPTVVEPAGHPMGRPRPHSAARPIYTLIPEPAAQAAATPTPEPARMKQAIPEPPAFIPEVRSEPELHHRMTRLAAVREEILGNRPALTPSQRAQRNRPQATRDRDGRLAYVTYTVDE